MSGCLLDHVHIRSDQRITTDPEQCWTWQRTDLLTEASPPPTECEFCDDEAVEFWSYGGEMVATCATHARLRATKSPAREAISGRRNVRTDSALIGAS